MKRVWQGPAHSPWVAVPRSYNVLGTDAHHLGSRRVAMNRKLISSGSRFEAEIGYSRAVVQGDWVFVSGTTGFDYSKMTISDDLVEQTEQCLRNIEEALSN